jgi:hypothetical protein
MRPGGAILEHGFHGFSLNDKSVFIREIRVYRWSFATKSGIA